MTAVDTLPGDPAALVFCFTPPRDVARAMVRLFDGILFRACVLESR